MLRFKNTSTDRTKSLLHRKAAKLEMEPVVGGTRLRMGESRDIPEEVYERNKSYYDKCIADGTLEIVGKAANVEPALDENGLKLGGPTLEMWVKAGYPADRYPPQGWAIVPSAGLDKFRKEQEEAKAAADAVALVKAKELAEAQAKLLQEAQAKVAEQQVVPVVAVMAANTEGVEKLEFNLSDTPAPAESATVTTESAGAPTDEAAVAEEQTEQKRGPGRPKKKLF